jgi:mannose-1-phosphate guanylyltransferase
MGIDYALILSAGLGTRMGEIGKRIPKVLWPVFFKTILELQIRYCEDLGVRKIYINTHFLHGEIERFLKDAGLLDKVTILHEEELLDSGGAIHNLAARPEVNYLGKLLLVNGDQFLFFKQEFWAKALDRLTSSRAVLFGINVEQMALYNETIIEDFQLIDIRKNLKIKKEYTTYSGLGLLSLNNLKPVVGISRFFETVANYKNEKVDMVTPDHYEYWDFGTAEIYMKNIFKINSKKAEGSLMINFLLKHSALNG